MPIALPDTAPWIDRLKSQVGDFQGRVYGAADYASAKSLGGQRVPAAYIVPVRDSAERNLLSEGQVMQRAMLRIAVVLAVRNVADGRGDAGNAELRLLRDQVLNALVGWKPADLTQEIEFDGGAVDQFRQQTLWWADVFRAHYLIAA